MTKLGQAIFDAEEFIRLANDFRNERKDLIELNRVWATLQMKSRAKMKRASMNLSDSLVDLRKVQVNEEGEG